MLTQHASAWEPQAHPDTCEDHETHEHGIVRHRCACGGYVVSYAATRPAVRWRTGAEDYSTATIERIIEVRLDRTRPDLCEQCQVVRTRQARGTSSPVHAAPTRTAGGYLVRR